MRIVLGLAECMVLAVNGDPLASIHAADEPHPPAHRPANSWVKRNALMRHGAVHIERGAHNGQMTADNYYENCSPPGVGNKRKIHVVKGSNNMRASPTMHQHNLEGAMIGKKSKK